MDDGNEAVNGQNGHDLHNKLDVGHAKTQGVIASLGLSDPALLARRSLSGYSLEPDHLDGRSPCRVKVSEFLESTNFEYALATIIMTNLCFIIVEADHSGQCESDGLSGDQCPTVLLYSVMNFVFLGIYTTESILRLYAYGGSFCADRWNPFDLVIVLAGYLDLVLKHIMVDGDLETLRMLRIFRIARLARTIKIFRHMPELQAMIRGFKSAIGAMGYGFVFILFLLLMAGILAVELLHPINLECDPDGWCKDAFLSVIKAVLLFFQTLVAGDSWGACAVPIVRNSPWTLILFACVLVIVQLGFTNLILAVIVEKAAEAREVDANTARRNRRNAIGRLARLAEELDTEHNGTISEEELREGVEKHSHFQQLLDLLDIDKHDVSSLFYLMDHDRSGDLSIEEFVRTIAKTSGDDVRKHMMFLRLKVTYHKGNLLQKVENLRTRVKLKIEGAEARLDELQKILNGGKMIADPGKVAEKPNQSSGGHWSTGGCFGSENAVEPDGDD